MIKRFIDKQMVYIHGGSESIRRFRDSEKWISSDSQMSIPPKKNNLGFVEEHYEINPFYISKFPVTVQLYSTVTGHKMSDKSQSSLPLTDVSWFEAVSFCNSLSRRLHLDEYYIIDCDYKAVSPNHGSKGFRLPAETEWQLACKGGDGRFQYGDINEICWHSGNSGLQIQEPGLKAPNAFGLYDMIGNVWEWCEDFFDRDEYDSYRVFRGGSYAEKPHVCGATTRRKSHPEYRAEDLGFRLARSV
jgi:formylglycine-generating enzyme required for sulfatase activity